MGNNNYELQFTNGRNKDMHDLAEFNSLKIKKISNEDVGIKKSATGPQCKPTRN